MLTRVLQTLVQILVAQPAGPSGEAVARVVGDAVDALPVFAVVLEALVDVGGAQRVFEALGTFTFEKLGRIGADAAVQALVLETQGAFFSDVEEALDDELLDGGAVGQLLSRVEGQQDVSDAHLADATPEKVPSLAFDRGKVDQSIVAAPDVVDASSVGVDDGRTDVNVNGAGDEGRQVDVGVQSELDFVGTVHEGKNAPLFQDSEQNVVPPAVGDGLAERNGFDAASFQGDVEHELALGSDPEHQVLALVSDDVEQRAVDFVGPELHRDGVGLAAQVLHVVTDGRVHAVERGVGQTFVAVGQGLAGAGSRTTVPMAVLDFVAVASLVALRTFADVVVPSHFANASVHARVLLASVVRHDAFQHLNQGHFSDGLGFGNVDLPEILGEKLHDLLYVTVSQLNVLNDALKN